MGAAATFALGHLSDGPWVLCLMPGMLAAIIVAGNAHAWPVWIAALGNFLFYFLLTWLVTAVWVKLKRKLR